MNQVTATAVQGINHIELRVRDLDRSAGFYCGVLGFVRRDASPASDVSCLCVGVPASGGERFSVALSEGFPASAELTGLDHVGLTVPTEQDVRDIYARAQELGIRATAPRTCEDGLRTFLFDPDGYKFEVTANGGDSRADKE